MESALLRDKAQAYLRRLSEDIPSRRVGSAGNRMATEFFVATVAAWGFETDCSEFGCIDWREEGVELEAAGQRFEAFASPYSLGCRVSAPLMVATNVEELAAVDMTGRLLLLRGEIAREQLMPKNFPFYNPEEHRRILQALETGRPAAILAATSRDVQMVGSQYPFPLFEDGDFDVPSVYMTEEEGQRLAAYAGHVGSLESRASRIPARGCNPVARKGTPGQPRLVLFAHIDSRIGSPGAGDNASGVVVLLLLAELLADYRGPLTIELVALNGEDYYANPGEQLWLAHNEGRFDEILLGINLDDVGYFRGRAAYSLYGCPPQMAAAIEGVLAAHSALVPGEPWYQGDHGLFALHGVPALAITSELLAELMAEVTHTPRDTAEKVDTAKLVVLAAALQDLILRGPLAPAGRQGPGRLS